MAAVVGALQAKYIIDVIKDFKDIIDFLNDGNQINQLYNNAIEQEKLTQDEQDKAAVVRAEYNDKQQKISAINNQANALGIEKEAFQKVVGDFSNYQENEQKRLNSSNAALLDTQNIFNAKEKDFSDRYASFQLEITDFENKKQNAQAQYVGMQQKLSVLNDEIDRKKAALDEQEKSVQEKFDRLKSIIGD